MKEGGDEREEVLSWEDSKGWWLSQQWMTPEPMNNSSQLCAESWFFLCVVHLVRDSCPRLGHKCEDLAPPAHEHSSGLPSACLLWGLKAILIPRGRWVINFAYACAHVHTDGKETKSKLHTYDMKAWYSSLELLFLPEHHPWFPVGKGSLYQEVVFSTLMSIFRLFHSWSGLDPRQVLFQAFLAGRCEELEGGSRKKLGVARRI